MTEPRHTTFNIRHLGPIDAAEVEMRPLTILAGPSGSGKSYLTHAFYGYYLMLSENGFFDFLDGSGWFANHPILTQERFDALVNNGTVTFTIDANSCSNTYERYIHATAGFYPTMLGEVFNLGNSVFDSTEFAVATAKSMLAGVFSSPPSVIEDMKFRGCVFSFTSELIDGIGGCRIDIRTESNDASFLKDDRALFAQFLDSRLFIAGIPVPFFITSDRASIGIFHQELDQTKDTLLSDPHSNQPDGGTNGGLADYTLPVQKNIDFIRGLHGIQGEEGMFGDDGEGKTYKYIERWFNSSFRLVNDELRLASAPSAADHAYDIPFHVASSGSREIALLYYFLKHEAREGNLLIIDEPETHLDPFKQILFARLIVNLVNSGLRVFISTHSDYIIEEISNLIKLHSDSIDKETFYDYFPEYVGQETLDYRKVGAYTCENRRTELAEIGPCGIMMPSLTSAIIAMNNVKNVLDGFLYDDDQS